MDLALLNISVVSATCFDLRFERPEGQLRRCRVELVNDRGVWRMQANPDFLGDSTLDVDALTQALGLLSALARPAV